MRTILVAGTDGWNDDGAVGWFCPGSPFEQMLEAHGVEPLFDDWGRTPRPFVWSTALAGVPFLTRKHVQWAAGGAALSYFGRHRLGPIGVVAHSHGLQVALYAAAAGLRITRLISVGSPVRHDMLPIAMAARPNIGRWLHLHSDRSDRWQWIGELFDGSVGIVRDHPLADANDAVPGVGHAGVLTDPSHFPLWTQRGWIAWLQ